MYTTACDLTEYQPSFSSSLNNKRQFISQILADTISDTSQSAHCSTISARVVSLPTLPGNTTKGTDLCRLVSSSHLQRGTPGAAWPTIRALLIDRKSVV